VIFIESVRITTWLTLLVFVSLAAWRSNRRPLVAAIAWLAGFETAYQVTAMAIHTPHPIPVIGPISLSLLIGMPLIAAVMAWLGGRPNVPLLIAALIFFAAWIASGFHVNVDASHIDAVGEILNDVSKTLWAAAYLLPLADRRRNEYLQPVPRDVVELDRHAAA